MVRGRERERERLERRRAERERERRDSAKQAPALVSSRIYIPLSHQLERFLWVRVCVHACVCVFTQADGGEERWRQKERQKGGRKEYFTRSSSTPQTWVPLGIFNKACLIQSGHPEDVFLPLECF